MKGKKKNRNSNKYQDEDVRDIERGGLRREKRKSRRRNEKQAIKDIYYGTKIVVDDLDPDPLYDFED